MITTMIKKEDQNLMIQKATSGYTVCFANQCPQHELCLRWTVGQLMPSDVKDCQCVNPHFEEVATAHCPMFRPAEKTLWAKGMTRLFTDDMPQKVETGIRKELMKRYNRTYFFEYRNGTRLIPPAMQEEIRAVCRQYGWKADVQFDEYLENYGW